MENIAFWCGPYLLAPTCDSMTIAWESTAPCRAFASFAEGAGAFSAPVEIKADADAPLFQGRRMELFRWTLEGLSPATDYRYRVTLEGGEEIEAGFRTLPEDPERLHLVTLSDSHAFATRETFDRAIWRERPDFIIHSGDIVEGTGAQAEQFAYFLRGQSERDFIHWFPVIYAEGNHDQGGPYFDAYIYTVQDARYGAQVRGDSSMDCGGLHISLMNSGPWGLGEMNAETAGKPADEETQREIAGAVDWLRRDLMSERAKNAAFRLLVMHHPYSDAYTARHIPAVAEPGRVDLLLAGHTHSYARYVSADPAVGAGTVYVTQQDARMYSARGDYSVMDVDFAEGLLTLRSMGEKSAADETVCAAETRIAREKQQLAFDRVEIAPASILCGDTVTVRARVTNTGRGLAAASIPVLDNGKTRWLYEFGGETVTLEPGESAELEAPLLLETLGAHELRIGDFTGTVEVRFRPAYFVYARPAVRVGDGTASGLSSSHVHISTHVRNIGNETGAKEIAFSINGEAVRTLTLELAAGQGSEVAFDHDFDRAGEYRLAIGGSEPCTVCIEGGIQGLPIVRDRSGTHHDAVIHGAPRRGYDEDGRRTLILDGRYDYLEIADDEGLHIDDAVTGIVWAKLPGEGTTRPGVAELTDEYTDGKGIIADHNPLLTKGVGLGWGTSYQFRMAIRDNGKVTYGVCFEDDNGEFGWNDGDDPATGIRKDEWVQYTSAFDLETGGDSYENGLHSAHVDAPVFRAPVKNWEGVPLRVGLGFKNKVHNRRGRGTYHTMLPGEISQVRFYTRKLTEAENALLRERPDTEDRERLQAHLRFEDDDLVLTGAHTTEWVACEGAPERLDCRADIPAGASIEVTVQYSADGEIVAGETRFALADGAQSFALDNGDARFLRLRTEMRSALGEERSAVPVLHEYALTAGKTHLWNTLDSWRRGAFTGAVGHQDGDVYRNHADDLA